MILWVSFHLLFHCLYSCSTCASFFWSLAVIFFSCAILSFVASSYTVKKIYIYIEHHLWRKTKLNWFLHRRWSDIVKRALFSAYDGDSASKVNQIINLLGLLCVELSVNFRFLLSVPVSASHLRPVEKKEERIKIHFWRLIRTVSNYIPINIMQLWRAKNSKIIKNYVIKLSFRVLLFWYFRAWQDLDNVPKLFVLW